MTHQPDDDLDSRWCSAEYPGDHLFIGYLCERDRGHEGDHECLDAIDGTGYTTRLTWTNTATPNAPKETR